MNKKIILILIILIETAIGSYSIYRYQKNKIDQKNVLGASKVTVIDKSKIIINKNHEMNYYYELEPNQQWSEHPEWLSYEVKYKTNNNCKTISCRL